MFTINLLAHRRNALNEGEGNEEISPITKIRYSRVYSITIN